MVQVDVFWAYGIGATFAAAAARQLRAMGTSEAGEEGVEKATPFSSRYFVVTILFLSCIFAPSGLWLLWQFPHWETMQVATSRADIPVWLVCIFAVTNITQGVLGYWVANRLIQRGKFYAAHLQWFLGYFGMFFILLYGWDGLGWQRFLYDATVMDGVLWSPGTHMGVAFLKSNVAFTLYGMSVFVIPPMFIAFGRWVVAGAENDKSLSPDTVPACPVRIGFLYLAGVFGVALAAAAGAAGTVYLVSLVVGHVASYIIGLPLFGILAWFLAFRRGMPANRFFKTLYIEEPGSSR
ncbi:hypothetical protein ACFL4G_05795 [Thermodesulfobacteriota bacterium]